MRKELRKNFVNAVLKQIDITVGFTVGIDEIVQMVESFRKAEGLFLSQCVPVVEDGFVFINNKPVGRVAAKMPRVNHCEKSYYYEGHCIGDPAI